jgi:hypothetical protein
MQQPTPAGGRRLWLFLAAPLLVALALVHLAAAQSPGRPKPAPAANGGGEYPRAEALAHADHLDPADEDAIRATIDANIARLQAAGRLPAMRSRSAVALGSPLRAAPGFGDPGFAAVTGFVDHNPAYPGLRLDYSCGARTYDTSGGYNHGGTDYYLWPFAWNKMAEGAVQVVAAAPGTLIHREDGNPDQSCSFSGARWNAVYIRHADGSVAWYGHLKRGSLTPKGVGEWVAAGEYLGLVGSSGNSTGPHLHFELHDEAWNRIDPYAGSCNATTATSWWQAQPAYNDSAVLKVMTGSAPVDWADACPGLDTTFEQRVFAPGARVTFTAFYRDQLQGQRSVYRLIRPDGTLYAEWDHASPAARYTLSYWWWAFDFSPNAPVGTWTFEVTYEGRTAQTTFVLDGPATPTPVPPTATPLPTPTPPPTPFPRELLDHWSFVPLAADE